MSFLLAMVLLGSGWALLGGAIQGFREGRSFGPSVGLIFAVLLIGKFAAYYWGRSL